VVWFLFGSALVTALDATTWQTVAFAILALTVVRMAGRRRADRISPQSDDGRVHRLVRTAWPGFCRVRVDRLDSLHGSEAKSVLAAVALTVLLSVVAHGLTASPLASRYGDHIAALARSAAERASVPVLAPRPRSFRRSTRVTAITELDE
jgi:hypothetical protein